MSIPVRHSSSVETDARAAPVPQVLEGSIVLQDSDKTSIQATVRADPLLVIALIVFATLTVTGLAIYMGIRIVKRKED